MDLPTPEQNPTGLHGRYIVTKLDGTPVKGMLFVLKLEGDDPVHVAACRAAARTYADEVSGTHLYKVGRELVELVKALEVN